MDTANQVEILDEAICLSLLTVSLGMAWIQILFCMTK